MNTRIFIELVMFLCLITPAFSQSGGSEQQLTLVLPGGDPAAGRRAFMDLKCIACHSVAGDADMQKPWSANPGPQLGANHSRQSPGQLMTSILLPSHVVSEDIFREEGGRLSPMGDFSEAMTVRQMVDLVAYIGSLDSK